MTSGLHLVRIPKCTVEREGWRKGMEPRRNTFNIFTDSSKTPDGAGAGIFFNELNLRQPYKLPNHCTIFQAELFAVWKAVELAETRTTVNSVVNLYIDSQAAIKGIIILARTPEIGQGLERILSCEARKPEQT